MSGRDDTYYVNYPLIILNFQLYIFIGSRAYESL
jgi:hypothetical protein